MLAALQLGASNVMCHDRVQRPVSKTKNGWVGSGQARYPLLATDYYELSVKASKALHHVQSSKVATLDNSAVNALPRLLYCSIVD